MRQIKIGIISSFPPQQKGEGEYTKKIVEEMSRRSAEIEEIHIFSHGLDEMGKRVKLIRRHNPRIILHQVWSRRRKISRNLSFIYLWRWIREYDLDVIHIQYGPNRDFGGFIGEPLILLGLILKFLRIPMYITLHSLWLKKDTYRRFKDFFSSGGLANLLMGYFSTFTRMLASFVTKLFLLVTAPESKMARRFCSEYYIKPSKAIEEVHPSIRLEISANKEEIRELVEKYDLRDNKVILCFGFVRPDKGYEDVIRAISVLRNRANNTKLIIAGRAKGEVDQHYLAKLKNLVKSLHLEQDVVFISEYIPDQMVVALHEVAQLVVLPYKRSVGASGPLNLAFGYGLPIVASNVSDHMDDLQNTIMLYQAGNVNTLSNLLERILLNPELMQDMATKSRNYGEQHTWEKVVDRYMKEYSKTIRSR